LRDAICREPIPWTQLSGPVAPAEEALARLEERLRASPVAQGIVGRPHFLDACASLWLEGKLALLEDLPLHDARMDIRSPTHELTRAPATLRTRRRIAAAAPDWPLSPEGLAGLRGDDERQTAKAGRRRRGKGALGGIRSRGHCCGGKTGGDRGWGGGGNEGSRPLAARPAALAGQVQNPPLDPRSAALADLILARPVASAGMIATELGVTPRAAQDMVAELGLREMTGRGRYRAWRIL
jgi:hypothetical protein